MTEALTKYRHLQQVKRTWTPVQSTSGELALPSGKEALQRGLALRSLEIPVGDFISDAMKGDLPQGTEAEGCKELLISNVKDEEKHDIALTYAAQALGIPDRFEKEAAKITQAWLDLDRHPVLKAVVLERSVFLVLLPMFRFLGDSGLRTTSADISRDEGTHVAANTLICHDLGLKPDKALNSLRRATLAWALQSLQAQHTDSSLSSMECKHLSSNYWLEMSDDLYARGKAAGLSHTRASRMPAFFETANQNLPQYA